MRKAPIQTTSSTEDEKEPEITLKLTEEVNSETEEQSFTN